MAKQTGIFKIIGTIGDITFYEMDGEFYARKKSSLDGKRVKKDPKFKRTMEEAIGFGKASTATRAVYWALPEKLRVHGFYGRLTGRMRRLMREGKSAQEAQLQLLRELCAEAGAPAQQEAPRKSQQDDLAEQLLKQVFNNPNEDTVHEQSSQQKLSQWLSDEREDIRLLLQETRRHKVKISFALNNEDVGHGSQQSLRRLSMNLSAKE